LKTVLALTLSATLLCTSARADVQGVSDPQDMPEDAIDIARAEHGHERYQQNVAPFEYRRLLRHRLTMHESWTYDDPEQIQIVLSFDTDGDPGAERELHLNVEDPKTPYAEMRNAKSRIVGYAKLLRVDDRSIEFTFPKRLLKKRLRTYRWRAFATSAFTPPPECRPPNPPCPMPVPIDQVPDDGTWLRHRVGSRS